MNKSSYFDNDVLCETDWVSDNLDNPNIKILEVDYDIENAYKTGHIKGAHMVWWKKDINDLLTRDLLTKSQFESLMSRVGATPESTLILYGDFNNWFAAFAFWVFKYYGHKNIKLMNGGRKKWELEKREYTTDEPSSVEKTVYTSTAPNEGIRAYLSDVKRALEKKETMLVDVRSNKEFNGEISAPPEYPMEHAQRAGHIPGAKNIPWLQAINDDGTFKTYDQLKELYEGNGIVPEKDVICYCRIGERSSHSWFVLKYLLGYPSVRNYDGSWTEWGNMIGNPIEK